MRSRVARLIGWACLAFLASALAFGAFSALREVFDEQTRPSLLQIAAYGIFHWLLLGVVTWPFLVAPVFLWPFIARHFPAVEGSRVVLALVLAFLAALAVSARVAWLELPTLRSNPAFLFTSSFYCWEWAALWVGLLIPRLTWSALRTGVFAVRASAA